MPIKKALTVYGVAFESLSELCRVLGYTKPVSRSNVDRNYGGNLEHMADIRLRLQGLSDDQKAARLQAEKDRYYQELPKKGRPVPLDRLVTFQAALRLACDHVTAQDLGLAITATHSPLTVEQLRAAFAAFAADFDLQAAGRVLARY